MAKSWQQLPLVGGNHRQNSPDNENFHDRNICNVWEAIEPAIICQAKTTLTEFLGSLPKDFSQTSCVEYLIVNSVGQLQGKLDKDKLLKYLVSKYSFQSTNNSLPDSLLSLLDLFDNLTLPLKIETSARQDCYVNHAWQESINSTNERHLDLRQKSNVSIAHWWMERQFNALQENSEAQKSNEINSRANFCCLLLR